MENILNNLYSYEYFGFYLIMSIIILILLFLIVLLFGKKDQHHREVEATKKLQQINADAFKEDSQEMRLETNSIYENKELEDTIVVTNIEDVPTLNNVETNEEIPEPELPVMENVLENNVAENTQIMEPLLERIEEKPLMFEATNIFDNNFVNVVTKEDKVEELQELDVPEFNLEEIVKEVEEVNDTVGLNSEPEIFSSVYVEEKPVEIKQNEEIPVEQALEELEFELPTLKKSEEEVKTIEKEEIEIPVLNDYNLNELSGETYTIK